MSQSNFDVVVLGGAAVDIMYKAQEGIPAQRMHGQSAPCTLEKHCMGGVGRNIAEVLARLKLHVAMLSMVGDNDNMGKFLMNGMQNVGIDTSCVQVSQQGKRTATYTALVGGDGELAAAAADMDIFSEMTPDRLLSDDRIKAALKTTRCLVVDANIAEGCCEAIIRHTKKVNPACIVVFEAVSRAKSTRCAKFLSLVDIVKPNLTEAIELAAVVMKLKHGTDTTTRGYSENATHSPYEVVTRLVEVGGVKNVICTMGANGVLTGSSPTSETRGNVKIFCNTTRLRTWDALPVDRKDIKKVTGAGDSLLACTIYGLLKAPSGDGTNVTPTTANTITDDRLDDAVQLGLIGARMALQSAETINPKLSQVVEEFVASKKKAKKTSKL